MKLVSNSSLPSLADRIVVGGGAVVGAAAPVVLELSGIISDTWGTVAGECLVSLPLGTGLASMGYLAVRGAVAGVGLATAALRFD